MNKNWLTKTTDIGNLQISNWWLYILVPCFIVYVIYTQSYHLIVIFCIGILLRLAYENSRKGNN